MDEQFDANVEREARSLVRRMGSSGTSYLWKKNRSGSMSALTDKQMKAVIKARDAGTLKIRMLEIPKKEERWKQDKPVPRGWCDRNITGFGDEEDVLL
jgi:hypothetical protein